MPNPSGTSSTTAADSPLVPRQPTPRSSRLLTPEERQALGQLLLRGASPALACLELDLELEDFWHTVRHDPVFAQTVRQLYDTLSHNVVAALYKKALQGDTAAQRQWLQQCTATLWQPPAKSGSSADDLTQLSDAELLQRLRAELPVVLALLEQGIRAEDK